MTTIAIDATLRDRLRTYGIAGDTYNDILRRLMDHFDRDAFLAEVRRQADATTDWVSIDDLDA